MLHKDQILDTPSFSKKIKIKKRYFWLFECFILGYPIGMLVLVLLPSSLPIFEQADLVTIILLVWIVLVTFFVNMYLMYYWHSTSKQYYLSSDKRILQEFYNDIFETNKKKHDYLSHGAVVILCAFVVFVTTLIVITLRYNTTTNSELAVPLIMMSSGLFVATICYCFLIKRAVQRIISAKN